MVSKLPPQAEPTEQKHKAEHRNYSKTCLEITSAGGAYGTKLLSLYLNLIWGLEITSAGGAYGTGYVYSDKLSISVGLEITSAGGAYGTLVRQFNC